MGNGCSEVPEPGQYGGGGESTDDQFMSFTRISWHAVGRGHALGRHFSPGSLPRKEIPRSQMVAHQLNRNRSRGLGRNISVQRQAVRSNGDRCAALHCRLCALLELLFPSLCDVRGSKINFLLWSKSIHKRADFRAPYSYP